MHATENNSPHYRRRRDKKKTRMSRPTINNHYVSDSICRSKLPALLMPARLMANFDPRIFVSIIIYECLINSFVLITEMDWYISISRVKKERDKLMLYKVDVCVCVCVK